MRSHTKRHKSAVHILLVGCTLGVVVLTVLQSKIPSGELLLRKIVLLKSHLSPLVVISKFAEKTKYYDLTRQKQLILNGWSGTIFQHPIVSDITLGLHFVRLQTPEAGTGGCTRMANRGLK